MELPWSFSTYEADKMGATSWGYTAIVCAYLSLDQGDWHCLSASWRGENDLTRPARKNIQMTNYQTIADAPEFPLVTITWLLACSHRHWKERQGESGTPTTLILSMSSCRTHWDKKLEVVLCNCIPTERDCVVWVCVAFRLQKDLRPCQMCHAPLTFGCSWMMSIIPEIKLRSFLLKTPSVGCRVFVIHGVMYTY